MRFSTTFILPAMALLILATGCRNTTTMRCERETALLRAEILDLEDKYYALQSQYRSGMQGGSAVVTSGMIGSGVIQGSPVVVSGSQMVVDSYPVQGDVIYEDQYIEGSVIQGEVVQGTMVPGSYVPGAMVPTPAMPVDGGVYYEGQVLPMDQPVFDQQVEPTPASSSDPGGLNVETPPVDEATSGSEQTLTLPESLELEVGFEDLELELQDVTGDVDRIEIVSEASRGKDLDGLPGHDGIELMIQTLNSDDEYVEQTGELTITVKDQLAGEIGKWTFLPKELELFLSRDEFGNMGTLLHLPWTEKIPVSKQVEVRVAMMIGNTEYIASRNLEIDPPTGQSIGNPIVGWAVDDDRWVSSAPSPRRQQINPVPSVGFANPSTVSDRPEWKPVR